MEGEQFSLCWNNFHNNLSSGFQALYKEEDLVDVTLAAEGKYIKAHKTVLSVCSPYFKELFKVNPCKHPIVILQNVNYTALSSLLQFMYQGEVSVGQEEIPMFMKVAETLKVKGLTDNSTSNLESNGLSDLKTAKKPSSKPIPINKKIIRPPQTQTRPVASPIPRHVQSPQPVTSPGVTLVSGPPPAKKPAIEEKEHAIVLPQMTPIPPQLSGTSSKIPSEFMDMDEGLLRPKEEPLDQDEDTINSAEDFDMNQMFPSSMDGQNWNAEAHPELMKPPDTSSPGSGLVFLTSRNGQLVVLHKGHMYTLSSTLEHSKEWVCVKKRTLDCDGGLTITDGPLVTKYKPHNHSQLNDVIKRLVVPQVGFVPPKTS